MPLIPGSSSSSTIAKRVSVTSAAFKASLATPIELLAAPATGTCNVIYSIVQYFTYIAPAYAAISNTVVYTISTAVTSLGNFSGEYASTSNYVDQICPYSGANDQGFNNPQIWPVIITTSVLLRPDVAPTTGNGTLVYYILYENKPIV